MEKKQLLKDLALYEDFITKEECQNTINLLKKLEEIREDFWKPISFYESSSAGYPEDNDPILAEFNLPSNWFSSLYQKIRDITAENANIPESKLSKISFHVQRWLPGAFAPEHSDNSSNDGVMGAFTRSRYATFLYLNDDFEGGELVFPGHNLTILPKAGMAATFHGGHSNMHRVDIVRKTARYTIGSFFDDREESDYSQEIRDAWAKELAEVRAMQKEQAVKWDNIRKDGLRLAPTGEKYPAKEVEG
jgi:Rps23 Pro-64 3,4-dihydroxylase Tpa1-like proline 4-hydroxylase